MLLRGKHVSRAVTHHEETPPVTDFRGLKLGSAFQPIVSLSHRRVVGHEALLRAHTPAGEAVSPPAVFALAANDRETVELDRLCRATHVRHYTANAPSETWLFLNVSATVVAEGRQYGAFFEQMLAASGFPAHRVVVEVLEGAVHDETRLADAAEYYRSIGCLVAIDDFGAGHSNFERIWRQRPDIVKLDHRIIAAAAADARTLRMTGNMVSMLHEAGSLVLIEGIETAEQLLAAMETDADFVQGYYLGRPTPLPAAFDPRGVLEPLCVDFHRRVHTHFDTQSRAFVRFRDLLPRVVAQLRARQALRVACTSLVGKAGFRRAYLLDERGYQIGGNIEDSCGRDPRYLPLANSSGANWFRRPYFRKAITRPEEVQRTHPYLSITDARMCVTFSIAFEINGEQQVLCCDIEIQDMTPRTDGTLGEARPVVSPPSMTGTLQAMVEPGQGKYVTIESPGYPSHQEHAAPGPTPWEESVARKQRDAEMFREYLDARLVQAYAALHDTVARHGIRGWSDQQRREVHAAVDTVRSLRRQIEVQRAFIHEIQQLTLSLHLHPELREFEQIAQSDW